MEYQNNQLLLNKRPDGMPDDDCWKLNTETVNSLNKNEILIFVLPHFHLHELILTQH